MLFKFPKFTPIDVLPQHFDTVLAIASDAGLTQISNLHISFLAWRNEELVEVQGGAGRPYQFEFESSPSEGAPHGRRLRGHVELVYRKTIPAWSENPRWSR